MNQIIDRDARLARELYNSQSEIFSFEQKKYNGNLSIRSKINSLLGEIRNKKILFVGCGDASECEYCINNEADVFGIDVSDKLIEMAKDSFSDIKDKFLVMDMEKTLFKEESFDIIVSIFSLMYKGDLVSVFREFSRILKPNGFVIFSVPHPIRKMIKYNSNNYFIKGSRYESWKGIRRFNYYRLIEDYIDSIVDSDMKIVKLIEPRPVEEKESDSSELLYPHHLIFIIKKESISNKFKDLLMS